MEGQIDPCIHKFTVHDYINNQIYIINKGKTQIRRDNTSHFNRPEKKHVDKNKENKWLNKGYPVWNAKRQIHLILGI